MARTFALERNASQGRLSIRMAWHLEPIAIIATFIAAFVGCSESRVPVFPVHGTVSFKGKPPVGAQVVLHAVNASGPTEVAPAATVREDGSFEITAYDPGDGAPDGDYVATIEWFKIVTGEGGGGRGPNVLPKQYASAKTSPVKVQVAGGPVEIPPIKIN